MCADDQRQHGENKRKGREHKGRDRQEGEAGWGRKEEKSGLDKRKEEDRRPGGAMRLGERCE